MISTVFAAIWCSDDE